MKKLSSTLPNMAIVLTAIAVIAGAVLAYVNMVTQGPIQEIQKKNLADGIQAVLGAEESPKVESTDTLGDAIVFKTDKGVAVQSVDGNAFGGTLKVLVGFDENGNIKGYRVLESSETPGLGAKAGDWFQASGKGNVIGMNPGEKELTVTKDGGQVEAITAATITSRAFLRAVNAAFKAYQGGSVDAASGATAQQKENSDCCKAENAECSESCGQDCACPDSLKADSACSGCKMDKAEMKCDKCKKN